MKSLRILRWSMMAALLLVALLAVGPAMAAHPRALRGTGGAIACAAPEAVEAGLEILRARGNAVDAAVATALALAVVHPQAGNLGGGGFAVIRFAEGEVKALDFREIAPAAATASMYLDADGEPLARKSLDGPLAAGVPGSPAGLYELHQELGRLSWARVVQPAIRLAEQGFVVSERLASNLAKAQSLFAQFPETTAVWMPEGRPLVAGTTFRQPTLGATLRLYAADGPKAITGGASAVAIEAASRRHGGVLTVADLKAYRPVWRTPVRFKAFGWEVASMPLPSSGGIILGQTFALLERLEWAQRPRFGADRAHLLAEVWRRAFADRFLLGDPLVSRASEDQLLATAWLDHRAQEIALQRATPSDQVRPWRQKGRLESSETTHLSVADGSGTVVSLTTTLNGRFGCGLVVAGLGFLLNNEMDDFSTAPGRPNQFGLIQGEANAVAPGRRMLSSMTPTVAWRDGRVVGLGSPGGSTIPTVTAQVLLNLVVDGDPLQTAVNRPRLHHQWLPDVIAVEADALAPETRAELLKRGHSVRERRPLGLVNAVQVFGGGEVEAAADPRGPEAAGVVTPATD